MHPGKLFRSRNRIHARKMQHHAALVQPVMHKLHLARILDAGSISRARRNCRAAATSCRRSANFSGKSVRISAKTSPLRPCVRLMRASHTHPSGAIICAPSDAWP